MNNKCKCDREVCDIHDLCQECLADYNQWYNEIMEMHLEDQEFEEALNEKETTH